MKEALKYLQAGAIVPVDMETTILLVNALKEALAQPAQEPVAYLVLFEGAGKLLEFKKGNYIHGAKVEHIPLYTTPPQREWVGLTDEEIDEGNKQSWVTKQAWESAVWWASEKLKEKNNG